jgi:hypothetical protein
MLWTAVYARSVTVRFDANPCRVRTYDAAGGPDLA